MNEGVFLLGVFWTSCLRGGITIFILRHHGAFDEQTMRKMNNVLDMTVQAHSIMLSDIHHGLAVIEWSRTVRHEVPLASTQPQIPPGYSDLEKEVIARDHRMHEITRSPQMMLLRVLNATSRDAKMREATVIEATFDGD